MTTTAKRQDLLNIIIYVLRGEIPGSDSGQNADRQIALTGNFGRDETHSKMVLITPFSLYPLAGERVVQFSVPVSAQKYKSIFKSAQFLQLRTTRASS